MAGRLMQAFRLKCHGGGGGDDDDVSLCVDVDVVVRGHGVAAVFVLESRALMPVPG